jgi:hypothetical protein
MSDAQKLVPKLYREAAEQAETGLTAGATHSAEEPPAIARR